MSEGDIHPADVVIGRNVRAQRKLCGWSQERLARVIGVSFQQLQKYERGTNRISGSKLVQISGAMEVPIPALFAGAPGAYASDAQAHTLPLSQIARDAETLRDLAASVSRRLSGAASDLEEDQ